MGTPEKIKKVAARIAQAHEAEPRGVTVVVSAMGDTTDDLIDLAYKVTPRPHEREMDMLLSVGERVSMALVSMALRDLGHEAISFTGSQAGIITDESHTRARIVDLRPTRVREELERGRIVIVAGFQGVSRSKEITTLGRGGSDTTAVALAAALGADRCEIYTDVAGIYSADPRLVPGARRYEQLPLDLVFEMAVKGAQVMHARSIEIARERQFPLYVGLAHPPAGASASKENGTMLLPKDQAVGLELPKVVAVTARKNLAELRFSADEAPAVVAELSAKAVLVHELASCAEQLVVLVDPAESSEFLERHSKNLKARGLSAVSVVGYQLQQNATVAARIVEVAKKAETRLAGLTSHPQSITVWFSDTPDSAGSARLVQVLHEALLGG